MLGTAVSADGVTVRYEVLGDGAPALVFVHGWSCDRTYWRGQIDHFARRHRVVTIDLGGHGESGLGRDDWTIPSFGDDVVAVLEQVTSGEVVLIGHSMGGDVIVEAALRLPDQVAGLIWVDVYTTLGAPKTEGEVGRFVAPFHQDFVASTRALVERAFIPSSDPELVEWVAADMSAAPPDVALSALAHAVGNEPPVIAGLGQVAAPVAAINPDHRPTDFEALERHGVRAVVMSDVGHFLMLEDPAGFNRLLDEVIAGFQVRDAAKP
jgi:pimeloyl-ACP methyl ester carboxylesterase